MYLHYIYIYIHLDILWYPVYIYICRWMPIIFQRKMPKIRHQKGTEPNSRTRPRMILAFMQWCFTSPPPQRVLKSHWQICQVRLYYRLCILYYILEDSILWYIYIYTYIYTYIHMYTCIFYIRWYILSMLHRPAQGPMIRTPVFRAFMASTRRLRKLPDLHTVDGPAKSCTIILLGFLPSQVVQDFATIHSDPQYDGLIFGDVYHLPTGFTPSNHSYNHHKRPS